LAVVSAPRPLYPRKWGEWCRFTSSFAAGERAKSSGRMAVMAFIVGEGTLWFLMYRKPISVMAWRSWERRRGLVVGLPARERSRMGMEEKSEDIILLSQIKPKKIGDSVEYWKRRKCEK
jgi:hypothetical protein